MRSGGIPPLGRSSLSDATHALGSVAISPTGKRLSVHGSVISIYLQEPSPQRITGPQICSTMASEEIKEAQHQTHAAEDDAAPSRALSRSLQGRHMQMIAIGGSIGAGLFVGTGGALRTGGPGSLVSPNAF